MISNDIIGAEDTEIKENLEVAGTAVLKNDVKIDEGLIIGNPTGGNKGAGTINAEKIYVDGSEIGGGGFSDCEVVEKECCVVSACRISREVSCPSDKWLISGGGICENGVGVGIGCGGGMRGLYHSYPKTAGKGGTWYIEGGTYLKKVNGCKKSCVKVYAICCK